MVTSSKPIFIRTALAGWKGFPQRILCLIPSAMTNDLDDIHPIFQGAPQTTEFRKLRKRIVRYVREAVEQYGMVERSDARWLVCLSGGKDSFTLLAVLIELKWRGLLPVDLLACNLDQGQPGFPATVLPEFLTKMGVPHRIPQGGPIALYVRDCVGEIFIGLQGKKGVPQLCWVITAMTSSRLF